MQKRLAVLGICLVAATTQSAYVPKAKQKLLPPPAIRYEATLLPKLEQAHLIPGPYIVGKQKTQWVKLNASAYPEWTWPAKNTDKSAVYFNALIIYGPERPVESIDITYGFKRWEIPTPLLSLTIDYPNLIGTTSDNKQHLYDFQTGHRNEEKLPQTTAITTEPTQNLTDINRNLTEAKRPTLNTTDVIEIQHDADTEWILTKTHLIRLTKK